MLSAALVLAGVVASPGPAGDGLYLVWDVDSLGIEDHTASLLNDMLVGELRKVLGERLVENVPEITLAVRREVDSCGRTLSCFAEIGGAIGAHNVVVGVASTLGDHYNLNLKVIDVRTGLVARKASATLTGDRAMMLPAMQRLVYDIVDPSVLKGALVVEVPSDGVDVYVDGKHVGSTPLPAKLRGLTTGEHTLKLSAPIMKDYFTFFTIDVDKTTTIRVAPDQIEALQLELEAAGVPLYKKWWFWTAIGAAVAGAAAATVYVLVQDPGPGRPSTTLGDIDFR